MKEGTEGGSDGRRQEERDKGGNESTMEGYFGSMRLALGILERLGAYFGVTLGLLWGHLGVTLALFGSMTVALGNFLVTFDAENGVDGHKWWLGGAENRKC